MKRKLTSLVLAIAVMLSLSAPAFAACPTSDSSACPANALLWQMLNRYAGSCGGQTLDVNALLGQLLKQYGATVPNEAQNKPETPPAETSEPATPAQPETPAAPEKPAQPTTPASGANAYEQEVVRLVNVERAKYGLAPLTEDALLTRTARMKSQDMRDRGYFDHNSPTYGTPFQLMKSQGVTYRTAGENIAMGYRTPEAVVNAWMNSSGHRANILNASYTRIGVGYVAEGSYWTQHFTG